MDYPFASLSIPRATLVNKEKDRYLVIRKNGEKILIDATSAAEAVEKSGVKDVRRVANLAFEAEQILEKGVLDASGEKMDTRITLEEDMPAFQVADLLEEENEDEAFVEFDLAEYSRLSHQGAPRIAEPEVEIPAVAAAPKPAPVMEAPVVATPAPAEAEPAKQIEIIDAPVEHGLQTTEKQLTPEEIEALLKN